MKEGMIYMFKVYASYGRKRMVSNETYATKEDAKNFIDVSIERQYALCCKGWGLCDYEVEELHNGYFYKATFKPCLTLFKNLIMRYRIEEVDE
jgi:hypothetical protein